MGKFNSIIALKLPVALAIGAAANAQCSLTWEALTGIAGCDASVFSSTLWDPDGPGPLGEQVVVQGLAYFAGSPPVGGPYNSVFSVDPSTGQAMTVGVLTGSAQYLAGGADGSLYAVLGTMRRWDGSAWSVVPGSAPGGGGFRSPLVLPDGRLLATGTFASLSGVPMNRAATWNGTSWTNVGVGLPAGVVGLSAATLAANGEVLFAGDLGGGNHAVMRWDGAIWTQATTAVSGTIQCIEASTATICIGGDFPGGAASWNGTTWQTMPASAVIGLARDSNGDLLGVSFAFPNRISRWNGTAWQTPDNGVGVGYFGATAAITGLLPLASGELVICGEFLRAGSRGVAHMARWDGAHWQRIGDGVNGRIFAAAELHNGDLVVGGQFTCIGGIDATAIARLDPSGWHPIPGGLNGDVVYLEVLANGDLVVFGHFTTAGGVTCNGLARWDGSWHSMGISTPFGVRALRALPDGSLVIGGRFTSVPTTSGPLLANCVARWHDGAWSSPFGLGLSGKECAICDGPLVNDIALQANGDLVVGGMFTQAGGQTIPHLARWNVATSTWSAVVPIPLSTGGQEVRFVSSLADDTLMIGGFYRVASGQAMHRAHHIVGSTWQDAVTDSRTSDAMSLPNGDILLAGSFLGVAGAPAPGLARQTASGWQGLVDVTTPNNYQVLMRASGDLLAVGSAAGADAYYGLGRLTSSCASTNQQIGAGCLPGSMVTTRGAWLGGTLEVTAGGLPEPGIALGVIGFSTVAVQLDTILPEALPGCMLRVEPALIDAQLVQSARVTTAAAIPAAPALLGSNLMLQFVTLHGSPLQVATTDALQVTAGAF